ncbi:hypothetical protein GCM10022383_04060 [Microbacterium soli]|uniref:Uncharacterized protein n=2 Tax=Microbacterium soli TaxID=446075 RepID=A0ABP7MTK5_9MICO
MGVEGRDDTLGTTVGFLLRALRAVGELGDPDAANRLAAQAWLALRDDHPQQAKRLNGVMHHLSRLPQVTGGESRNPPTDQEDR